MMGMIAQEVKEIVPELTFQNQIDGYYGLHYGETTALLIEAFKEQQNQFSLLRQDFEGQAFFNSQFSNNFQLLNDKNASLDDKFTIIGNSLEELENKYNTLDSRLRGNDDEGDGNANDDSLKILTLTIDEINQSVSTITQLLDSHEERIRNLEDWISINGFWIPAYAGMTGEGTGAIGEGAGMTEGQINLQFPNLNFQNLEKLTSSLQISELAESGEFLFDISGNLKVKELEADKIKAGEVEAGEVKSEGVLNIGKYSEPPICDENQKGGLYFDTEENSFFGCDGENWRKIYFEN